MSKKKWIGVAMLVAGIAMISLTLIIANDNKPLSGVMLGVGTACGIVGVVKIVEEYYETKYPQLARQKAIELKDERNEAIRNHAKAVAGDILQWCVMGLAFLLILVDVPLWLILIVVAIYLAYSVLTVICIYKFQREM